MNIESHRVVVGACGWQHQEWLDDFYPDDLPADWRVSYYSNEFMLVYVPADDWLKQEDISEWLDNVDDAFRFILEMPVSALQDAAILQSCLVKAAEFNDFCLGLVFQLEAGADETGEALNFLQQAADQFMVSVDAQGREISSSFLQQLAQRGISVVWHGQETRQGLDQGKIAVTRISSDDMDAKQLRNIIETCMSASDKSISVLCMDGHPPDIEVMNNAKIILELL